jgi:hypothetical protein
VHRHHCVQAGSPPAPHEQFLVLERLEVEARQLPVTVNTAIAPECLPGLTVLVGAAAPDGLVEVAGMAAVADPSWVVVTGVVPVPAVAAGVPVVPELPVAAPAVPVDVCAGVVDALAPGVVVVVVVVVPADPVGPAVVELPIGVTAPVAAADVVPEVAVVGVVDVAAPLA